MAKLTQPIKVEGLVTHEPRSNDLQTAKARCSSSGARLTDKRQKLLEVLLSSPKPLSAYELVDHYRDTYDEALQAMTVYRILEFLADEQLVHKLNLNNKFIACSRIRCCEGHSVSQFMICTECEKVEEVSIPAEIWQPLARFGGNQGFSLESAHMEVACICQSCKDNQTAE